MSDHPENPSDTSSNTRGGWHTPQEPKLWQERKREEAPKAGWRQVKALPDEMPVQPERQGTWHLPAPEDTVFNPDDEVRVQEQPGTSTQRASISPEDMIASILQQSPRRSAAPRPEDFVPQSDSREAAEPISRPEDFELGRNLPDARDEPDEGLEGLEALGALDDEDDDALSMSELVALASLELEAQQGEAYDPDEIDPEDLSPAQRALFQAASEAADYLPFSDADTTLAEDDAVGEAAQMADDGSTIRLDADSGEEDAASVAARMAAEVRGDTGTLQGTEAYQQPHLSPEQQELANQFRETRRQVSVLREMYNNGQISYDELQNRLREHTILDPDNNWWMVGFETNSWYRYNNETRQWEDATPPVPLDAGAPRTATTDIDPADIPNVVGGSLPYIEGDSSAQEFSDEEYDPTRYNQAQQQYSGQFGDQYVDEGTPIPRPGEPLIDPDRTMVGSSVDRDDLTGYEDALRGIDYIDATAPSQTVAGETRAGSLVDRGYDDAAFDDAADFDPDMAPDYDLDRQAPAFEQQKVQDRNRLLGVLAVIVFVFVACGLVSGIGVVAGAMVWFNNTVDPFRGQIAALGDRDVPFQNAQIRDANGELIVELVSGEGAREQVDITEGEVSPYLLHAVIASEDESFYENPGFSIPAIIRAFLQNLGAGEVESGASTITQQVARNLILQDTEVSAQRKATEIAVALEIANTFDKNQILNLYLNDLFFGNQSFGVEAASEFYFDKSAADLNMAEAAMLAGIIPSPSSANPVRNREAAFENMRDVIRRMVDVGCLDFQHGAFATNNELFCIGEDTFTEESEGERTRLLRMNAQGEVVGGLLVVQIAMVEGRPYSPRGSDLTFPHFVNLVVAQVEDIYGPDTMFQQGFIIETTLVPRIQQVAERALEQQVDSFVNNGINTGAVIVIEPQTGAIRALVGSPDFTDTDNAGQVDNTRTFQQPGSAIKPLVYATAINGANAQYLTPVSILWDVPSEYTIGGQVYRPVNFDGTFNGPVTVRSALQNSLNVPAVKALNFIGFDPFRTIAERMGINFLPEATIGLPSALGANDVRLVDLAEAYATLANDGINRTPFAITSITTGDGVDVPLPERQQPSQAVPPATAFVLQNILSDDAARAQEFGTNTVLSGQSLGLPNQNHVAAKTGTSDGARDLWTVGFTNNWVVGVWVGTVENSPTTGNLTGSRVAAPVWNAVMREALNNINPGPFTNPGGVVEDTVCLTTGTLAGPDCPTRSTDIYIASQPPPPPEQGFVRSVAVDSWTGQLANQFCPDNQIVDTFVDIDDPFALNWLRSTARGQQVAQQLNLPADLEPPPTQACQQGQPLPTIRLQSPTDGMTVSGDLVITGQVSTQNLQRWELQIAQEGTANFTPISEQRTDQIPQAGTILMTWDSRQRQNGNYILRLAAFSTQNEGFIFVDRNITISNTPPTPTPTPQPLAPTAALPEQPLLPPTPTATIDPLS